MTEPHSDNKNERMKESANDTMRPFATQPPTGGVFAGASAGGTVMSQSKGIPLLDGKYLALERYAGGMGVVYKCVKQATGQVVALKTVQSDGPMTADEIKSMKRNYDRVHRLSHDNIVRANALEVDQQNGQWYVEMDWVEGESLEGRYRQFGGDMRLVALDLVRVLRQVAVALDYAHDHGVIHRDVKDANIMIDKTTGNAILIDFGIASRAHRAEGPNGTLQHNVTVTTTTGVFAGTRGYQSPEQWRGEPAVAASDEYSLAVTAYRCLSGHLPFWSPNEGELQEMVLNGKMPPIMSLPDAANDVLKKGLAKTSAERYSTCRAFIDALELGLLSLAGDAAQPQKRGGGKPSDGGETSFTMAEFYILSAEMEDNVKSVNREWDRGQTFGNHLDAFGKACNGAKAATEYKDYAVAYDLYKQAENEWKWLEVNGPMRASAATRREEVKAKRSVAEEADAERLAKEGFGEAVNQLKTAEGDFEAGRFEESEEGFKKAEKLFSEVTEVARRAKRMEDLEKSVKEAIETKRFQDARQFVSEMKTLDAAKASLWEEKIEAVWKSNRIAELEKDISEAIEAKRFQDARQFVSEMKTLDAVKAASWEETVEAAWKSNRIAELEKDISEAIEAKRFQDARQYVDRLRKLDAAKAASVKTKVDSAEAAWKSERLEQLEKTIRKAVEEKRFEDARQAVAELKELDTAKAASWNAAIEEAWKADRIATLEQSISMSVLGRNFQNARKTVTKLKTLDAEKAASLETKVDSAEVAWKSNCIAELEKDITVAIGAKRFQDALRAVDELRKLDAAKVVSLKAEVESAETIWKADRIRQLEEAVKEAVAAKRLQDARRSVLELKELDAAKAAMWETTVDNTAAKAERIETLTRDIRRAIDEKDYQKARQAIGELKELDAEEAAKWEEIVEKAKIMASRKARKRQLIGIALTIAVLVVVLAVLLKPNTPDIKPYVQDIAGNYLVTLKPGIDIKLVKVEAGHFKMGSPVNEAGRHNDELLHKVTLTKDYWLGQYEVTQAQYEAIMKTKPSRFKNGGDYPVESVSWNDAMAFCRKLNELFDGSLPEGYRFDLPTEAQWEYACRAGTTTAWHYGDSLSSSQANFDGIYPGGGAAKGKYLGMTTPAGSYSPNAWGLYDMHGNVWEWCRDVYEKDYASDPEFLHGQPFGDGGRRVGRGGSWLFNAAYCRSALRSGLEPTLRDSDLGFRVALARVQ